jgi:hypothetical protein
MKYANLQFVFFASPTGGIKSGPQPQRKLSSACGKNLKSTWAAVWEGGAV